MESSLKGVVTVMQNEMTHQDRTEIQSESGFLTLSQWLLWLLQGVLVASDRKLNSKKAYAQRNLID